MFKDDLELLKKHAEVIVLSDESKQAQVAIIPALIKLAALDSRLNRATRFSLMPAIAETALHGQSFYIGEGAFYPLIIEPYLYFPQAGSIDDNTAAGNNNHLAMSRRVPSALIIFADCLHFKPFLTQDGIDNARFTDAR